MYTTPITSLIRPAVAASAVLAFVFGSVTANAQTLQFTPNAPLYTDSFTGLVAGEPIRSIGWTNSTGTNQGIAPAGSEYPLGGVVVTNPSNTRDNLRSPVIEMPDLSTASVVYTSAYIYHSSTAGAGAGVYLETASTTYVGGFRILDGTSGNNIQSFGIWGGTGQSWHYSTEKAKANHWYEIALVIQLDDTDISLSKGYLFIRDLTEGDTDFRLVDGLGGIDMGYTDTRGFSDFNKWRIEGFRSNEQLGALSIGSGTLQAIPEPTTASILLLSGLAVGGYRLYNKKRSTRH